MRLKPSTRKGGKVIGGFARFLIVALSLAVMMTGCVSSGRKLRPDLPDNPTLNWEENCKPGWDCLDLDDREKLDLYIMELKWAIEDCE